MAQNGKKYIFSPKNSQGPKALQNGAGMGQKQFKSQSFTFSCVFGVVKKKI